MDKDSLKPKCSSETTCVVNFQIKLNKENGIRLDVKAMFKEILLS